MYLVGTRAGIYSSATVIIGVIDNSGVVDNSYIPAVINIVVIDPWAVNVLSWYKRPIIGWCIISILWPHWRPSIVVAAGSPAYPCRCPVVALSLIHI